MKLDNASARLHARCVPATPGFMGEPLQILTLGKGKEHEKDVQLILDNVARIRNNLQEHHAELVSIIGVMGSYRTGKSFLLDLLLRYMRNMSCEGVKSDDEAEWVYKEDKEDVVLPPWVYDGNATHITEGKPGEAHAGFEYRSGMEKCTQGIWIWSQPFMFVNKQGQRVAVLLMDTQGAWDSSLSPHQSATIFGLTAMLSSKLIYNIQNKIEEQQLGNMDYFTTIAQAAVNGIPGGEHLFGKLEILIRDWCHYDDGWNLQQCRAQMKEHLEEHVGKEHLEEHEGTKEDSDRHERDKRLRSTFKQIDCYGLVHPGKKMTRKNWDGAIKDIDRNFFILLDDYCRTSFAGDPDFPQPSSPLGTELNVANFENLLKNYVGAFRDNQGMAVALRPAFVKVQTMTAREKMIRDFVSSLSQELPEPVYDPMEFEGKINRIKDIHVEKFTNKLRPFRMAPEDEKVEIKQFIQLMDEPMNLRLQKNNEVVESGARNTSVAGVTVYMIYYHHVILYIGVPAATYMTLKKHAGKKQKGMLSMEVLKATGEDGKIFILDRYRDMQATRISAGRLTSKKVKDRAMHVVAEQAAVGELSSIKMIKRG